jgi:hypothetical protein
MAHHVWIQLLTEQSGTDPHLTLETQATIDAIASLRIGYLSREDVTGLNVSKV